MWITTGLLLAALLLTVVRMVLGPTMVDRVLAINLTGTITVVLICLVSILVDDGFYIDIALTYGILNFIGTVAFLRYIKARQFHD